MVERMRSLSSTEPDRDVHEARPHLVLASPGAKDFGTKTGLALMTVRAEELARALSSEKGFEIPERLDDDERDRVPGTRLFALAAGAEYNVYVHRASSTVYKIPHQDNWKFWGDRVENRQAMKDALELQKLRYEQVDTRVLSILSAEYAPTYFIAAPDSLGHDVFVTVQPYLDPAVYKPHRLSKEERRLFEAAHVDDLTAANVLRHQTTGQLVLMDCLFATELVDKPE